MRDFLLKFIGRGGLIVLIVLFLVLPAKATADPAPITVTITQRVPIETVSPTGDVLGVGEATVGTKLTWVSSDGDLLMLQDDQGKRFRIAQSATDYVPVVVEMPSTNAPAVDAAPAPSPGSNGPSASATNAPGPNVAAPPAPSDNQAVAPAGQVVTVAIGDRATAKEMSVWPAGGLAGRPVLIVAHGHGGSGPAEIQGWLALAKQHQITIVCPSFLSSVNCSYLSDDAPYFKDCLRWIADNLQYDKDNVYMTGFSGGGFATWYLATQYPEIFRGIFLQSGNFAGNYFNLDLSKWYKKPIKIIWGSNDLPDIPVENKQALEMLKSEDCKNFTSEIIPGAHHQPHHDLVINWIEQVMASQPGNE